MSYKDVNKQREYAKLWVRKRRLEFFKDKVCEKCGSIEKLELHHKNPKEKEDHKIWSWSEERREKELKKCVVWCRKCHSDYHHNLLKKENHGTHSKYAHGCRCDLCREGHRSYQAKRNKLRRDG